MVARRWIAVVLAILAVPLLVLGLIDPLEGGIALLAVVVLGIIVWLLSRVRPPKLAWIALLATVIVGAITLGIAIAMIPPGGTPEGAAEVTVANPMRWLAGINWIYRAGVVVTAVGWVMWIVRLIRAARSTPAVQ